MTPVKLGLHSSDSSGGPAILVATSVVSANGNRPNKVRELREGKRLSQGDMGRRSGLLQCYVSRVERGRTIPNV